MANSYPPRSSKRNHEQNDRFGGDYRSYYEPSAPPYYRGDQQLDSFHQQHYASFDPPPPSSLDEFDEFPHGSRHREDFPPEPREPPLGQPEQNETLGGYLFKRLVRPVFRGSHTVVRVDLRRSLAYDAPVLNKGPRHRSAPAGAVASSGGRDYLDDEETQGSRGWLNGISGGGARLKLMQVWDAPQDFLGDPRIRNWNLNIGFGLNVEVDRGLIQPRCRLSSRHIALHLLPQPEVELRGRWPLGRTRIAVNLKYRIPLTMGLEDMWSSNGARLMVNFFNPLGSGVHLTPGGLELDEHLVQLGEHTKLRFAATLGFPRKLPLEEGEQPVTLRVHRLGVKTVIRSDDLDSRNLSVNDKNDYHVHKSSFQGGRNCLHLINTLEWFPVLSDRFGEFCHRVAKGS